jgi:hypothetical protein
VLFPYIQSVALAYCPCFFKATLAKRHQKLEKFIYPKLIKPLDGMASA